LRKIAKLSYITFFFLICCFPLAFWSTHKTETPVGNAPLASMPAFINDNGKFNLNFTSEFSVYFSDHLPFRSVLVSADAWLKSNLFSANTGNVISGKDGFLFSNETINDYIGITASNRKINNIAVTLMLLNNNAVENGNRFLFFAAPNKNSIYSMYMPNRYKRCQTSNIIMLYEKLEDYSVNYVDIKKQFDEIINNQNDNLLYHKRDSHWNNLGALYGFYEIAGKLNKTHKTYTNISYEYKKSWQGDLDQMLFPSFNLMDYQYKFDLNLSDFTILKPRTGRSDLETLSVLMGDEEKIDTLIQTRNNSASDSLYMLRDSFGRAMLPYLLDNYNKTAITRYAPMDLLSLTPSEPTDIIYEIAERHLINIVDTAPLMYAPLSKESFSYSVSPSDKNGIYFENTGAFLRIYGFLDENYFEDSSRIFLTLTNKKQTLFFEAFPIFEEKKLSSNDQYFNEISPAASGGISNQENIASSDYGFSLMLDIGISWESIFDVSITVTSADTNINTGRLGILPL